VTRCDEVPLIEFIRAELEAEEFEGVLQHVEVCEQCRERLQVLTAVAATYPAAPAVAAAPRVTSSPRIWLLAAALLVALLAPIVYLYNGRANLPHELATLEKYPAAFPLLTRDGTPSDRSESVRRLAHQAYSRADYRRAEELFGQLRPDAESYFYAGVSQYFLGDHQKALFSLDRAMELDQRWEPPALWYRASAFLKLGQEERARQTLSQLVQGDHEYRQKGLDLLKKLE
jgi:tetratricopeptide (TPR) repeat protein